MGLTDYIVPLLLAGTAVCALARRVDVYAALTAGAGEGLRVMARICPALIGLLTAVGMFRASGAMDALAGVLAPLLRLLGIPPETAALLDRWLLLLKEQGEEAAFAVIRRELETKEY